MPVCSKIQVSHILLSLKLQQFLTAKDTYNFQKTSKDLVTFEGIFLQYNEQLILFQA